MSPGKDTEGRHLLGSLLTKLILGSALKAASGKAVTPGAVARGNPGVFSLQLPLGLLPFHVDTSLHPLQKRQLSRADQLGSGGQTSIPIPALPPTCLVTLDRQPL